MAAACAAQPPAAPPAASEADAAARLAAAYERLRANGLSGAVVVRKGGALVYAAGAGEAGPGIAFTPDTAIDIASISKPVTGMAVLKLVEQGRLRLDDTIGRWFPEAPKDKQAITLRQLLSHSSGIVDIPAGMTDYTPVSSAAMGTKLLEAPLEFPPGSKWSYSNGGFGLLAFVVERASGQSLFAYLQEQVFARAGVAASYDPERFPGDRVAQARRDGGWRDVRALAAARKGPFWGLWGAGGLFISAADLARLCEAFMAGRIVRPALVREALAPVIAREEPGISWGLGWGLIDVDEPASPARLFASHTGGSGHSNTDLRHYPELGLTIATVTNQGEGAGPRAARDLSRAWLGLPPR